MRYVCERESTAAKAGRAILSCLLVVLLFTGTVLGGQQAPPVAPVSGVVLDPDGAVIADAKVILRHLGNRQEQMATTDPRGVFQFARVAGGEYEVEVQKEGFQSTVIRLVVGAKPLPPLQVKLPIAEVHEELTVGERSNQVSVNPDDNFNVVKLQPDTLKNLPVLGTDVIPTLANLLDAGSIGSAGAQIIIDGLERPGQKVSAAKIQEIRINQNPYSAEFSRPGRGRIEVITKAGSPDFHGEFNFIFRDHRLDARNAFAVEQPPEQRRIYEGNLTGPIGKGENTSFLFGVEREEEDLQAVIFASTPGGIVSQNVDTPMRETELSFRFNHQIGKNTTFSLRYEFSFDSSRNDGVGGFNLPAVAVHSTERDHDFYFTHRRILSLRLVNEFTMRISQEKGSARSEHPGVPRLVVLDAFTGGGGQTERQETETELQFNEILSWTMGKHFLKAGVNLPGFNRRRLSDRSNFGGTFSFSTLEDFEAGRPFLYTLNQGDSDLEFWQKEFGLFVQDQIAVRPNFSLALGLRYDWQNYLEDHNNLAPRLSFAYAPDKKRKMVIRGGLGFFYDRTGAGPIRDMLRLDGNKLRLVTITNPRYPDPITPDTPQARQPSSIVRFAPDLRSPYTFQFSLGLERQLNKTLTATANYINTRGVKLFRSLNVNAPPPPFYLARPDLTVGVLRQIESSAHLQAHALELMLRGRVGRIFNGTLQYNLGRAYNNAGGINALPANTYDLSGEWARADFAERHRFQMMGAIEAGEWFNLGLTLSLTSGRPYSLTTGRDDNRDSLANDRPSGVRRNSLQGPGVANLDVRWTKEFPLQSKKEEGPQVKVAVDAFNVLNRTNYTGYVGNLSSPFFGLPVASRPARRLQFSFGFEF